MLHLRIATKSGGTNELQKRLAGIDGVRRISESTCPPDNEVVLAADIDPTAADHVVDVLRDLEVPAEDYLLTRLDVVAPFPVGRQHMQAANGFAWIEIVGHARANARPLARYLALMAVSGIIAALGVITDNSILIVGAMAVSPDLLPICATCVGLVLRRRGMVRRAFGTLMVGLGLIWLVAFVLTAFLDLASFLPDHFDVGAGSLSSLAKTDYSTVIIALAAGVAGILSFETRASAAVGVAISVTTIPASAYFGVALAVGQESEAWGALAVLAVNVVLMITSGAATLIVQRWAGNRGGTDVPEPPGDAPAQ